MLFTIFFFNNQMPPYLLLLTNASVIYDISGYVGDIWKIMEKRLGIRYIYYISITQLF
jgi:hypothetical protein